MRCGDDDRFRLEMKNDDESRRGCFSAGGTALVFLLLLIFVSSWVLSEANGARMWHVVTRHSDRPEQVMEGIHGLRDEASFRISELRETVERARRKARERRVITGTTDSEINEGNRDAVLANLRIILEGARQEASPRRFTDPDAVSLLEALTEAVEEGRLEEARELYARAATERDAWTNVGEEASLALASLGAPAVEGPRIVPVMRTGPGPAAASPEGEGEAGPPG